MRMLALKMAGIFLFLVDAYETIWPLPADSGRYSEFTRAVHAFAGWLLARL